ncbi:hypothetical protein SAMN04487926_14038 [Paraburkholderia steynii]|uniref:Integrase catalytic domain-containing protein n=1 Tax=Paraburkholderia steynii TaxID=1245441 RepID=A0A7Z7BHQ9_9BURK|nr:hypothetical protein [Paraburkholderia steynii]SDJ27068.1 hypothetical protein SAMN04487926_14038 [Paraburkholderia steynii]
MDIILWEGQLIFGRLNGIRGNHHFRVVWIDRKNGIVFIRRVYSNVPANSRLAKKYTIADIQVRLKSQQLIEQDECIRPFRMSESREDIKEEIYAREVQAYRQRLLGPLITEAGRRIFYGNIHDRARLLEKQARKTGVSVQRLLKLFTIYENFGCNLVALRPYVPDGERERGATAHKRGAKNVYEEGNSASPLKGYPVNRWALRHIQWAVWHLVILLGFTYEDARVVMHRLFWHQDNGAISEGTRTRFPVKTSKMVTAAEFAACARRYKKNPEKLRRLVGAREWRDRYAAGRGVTADLALGPGDILIIDGTLAKFEIVSTITRRPIGRPTLLIVADAALGTILSIHITTGRESANAYRAVLFRACTPQSGLMSRLGLPRDWFNFRVRPNDILIDRGAGNSDKFRKPLVSADGADIGIMVAPIACGRAKGPVEGLMNILTRRLRNLPGAFTRERTERAQDRRRYSKLVARITRSELLRYAYEAAKEYNQGLVLKGHLPDTRRRSVQPTREELFNDAMLGRRGGENREFSEVDVYTALLPRLKPRRMHKAGVRHLDANFTSKAYQEAYEMEIAKCLGNEKKLPRITPLQDPDDPTILFWKRGPNDILVLDCSSTDAKRWDGLLVEDVERGTQIQDRKTRIRHEREKTFITPLPQHIVDAFIDARRTVFSRVSTEEQSSDRAFERDLERTEVNTESRVHSGRVAKRTDSPEKSDHFDDSHPSQEDREEDSVEKAVEAQMRKAREARKKVLDRGMETIVRKGKEGN